MKGFRTILVSLFSLVVSVVGGTQIDMTPLQHGIVASFLAASFSLIIILRIVTNTPVGKAVVAQVDKDIGLTPEMKQAIEQTILPLLGPLLSQVPQGASMAALVDSLQKLHSSVDEVKTLAVAAAAPPELMHGVSMITTGAVGEASTSIGTLTAAPAGTMIFTKAEEPAKPAT